MGSRNQKLEEIKQDTLQMERIFNNLVDQKSALSYNLERWASWLFILSVIGGLIAVFTQVWIGILSISMALVGCVLLIYKFKANLLDAIDVNLWLATRCAILAKNCTKALTIDTESIVCEIEDQMGIGEYEMELEQIKIDGKAYAEGIINSSLKDYYEDKYLRNKYSSKLKNRYNKHEIKQYM